MIGTVFDSIQVNNSHKMKLHMNLETKIKKT